MTDPNLFNQLLIWPILNVLIGIYKGLYSIDIPGAFGFAIIVATLIIRFLLYPLMTTQLKSAKKLSDLKPELDKLSQIHKDDKQRLQQEQLRLYKERGINPAAGCLPLLIQMPILIALYNVFFQVLGASNPAQVVRDINKVVLPAFRIETLNITFFGLNLAARPSDWQKLGIWILAVPIITGLLQYLQTKMMTPSTPQRQENKIAKKDDKKPASPAGREEDMSAVMQKQMGIMMPLMIGFFAYSFPIGLSLYWNTFTVFGIIQQHFVNKEQKYGSQSKS
ncbi:YidC/Oxa1 family membrane protein insertase [Candidatus Gottesmanbacteria bacterium]|nr:YidC/Oxa1 family membrane protein insertase [Candidatus Gottesmanbacteria bacterium]